MNVWYVAGYMWLILSLCFTAVAQFYLVDVQLNASWKGSMSVRLLYENYFFFLSQHWLLISRCWASSEKQNTEYGFVDRVLSLFTPLSHFYLFSNTQRQSVSGAVAIQTRASRPKSGNAWLRKHNGSAPSPACAAAFPWTQPEEMPWIHHQWIFLLPLLTGICSRVLVLAAPRFSGGFAWTCLCFWAGTRARRYRRLSARGMFTLLLSCCMSETVWHKGKLGCWCQAASLLWK